MVYTQMYTDGSNCSDPPSSSVAVSFLEIPLLLQWHLNSAHSVLTAEMAGLSLSITYVRANL